MAKIVSADQAACAISDNASVAIGGFCGFGSSDEVFIAIRNRFKETGSPRNLTIVKGVSVDDMGERGVSRLAVEGLVGKVISGHVGLEPALSKMIVANKCMAYMLPLGTITELFHAIAAHRPGAITKCGLETFCDPRVEGSKVNELTRETGSDIVSLENLGGEECLFYKTFPVDVCIIRGTYADEDGNISMEKEAIYADQMEAAAAAHNSGGIVIVQVEDIVKRGSLDARFVKLHHFMVDYIVKARAENHIQGFDSDNYRPELTGAIRKPLNTIANMPLNERKICGRRAAMELKSDTLVNLGIGMPDSVAAVAGEEGFSEKFTLSIESGVLGGVPLPGLGLGATVNPEAIYKMADIVNIYDGGGLDTTVLGLGEIDEQCNVNVSMFGGRITGPGGFIDISQNTKNVIFTGTFTANGLETKCENGKLKILTEGQAIKFKKQVEQITFSGCYAKRNQKDVLIVTERAVFRLTGEGLMLTEIAPGISLEKDVLAHMEFRPLISTQLREMDSRIFLDEPMGLRI